MMEVVFRLEDLDREKPVHLVGIGGAGMSAVATVLLEMGYRVEGSDLKESRYVRRLRGMGAVVGIGHRADNLGTASVVVRSSAIKNDNPELVEAARKKIPVVTRAEMLSAIMATRRGIAVAGTHGKTTTSSMIAQMMASCELDPSYLIGGELNEIGGNAHYGSGDFLVAEADESDGSLLCLKPHAAVLTNVDSDHLDYFGDIECVVETYRRFLELLPDGGPAVVCGDDELSLKVGREIDGPGGRVFFYGSGEWNDYRFGKTVSGAKRGGFTVEYRGEELGRLELKIPGLHNVYNSVASLAIGHQLGIPLDLAIKGLNGFQGVRRRFETVGRPCGVVVVDDYAHHPTEIRAVLDLARSVHRGRIVAVFQPHRYTRTRLLAPDFGDCFTDADLVVVTDIYAAGEDPEPGITGELIVDKIIAGGSGLTVVYEPNRLFLAGRVVELLRDGDMVLTIGAGDITQCAREIVELLEESGC